MKKAILLMLITLFSGVLKATVITYPAIPGYTSTHYVVTVNSTNSPVIQTNAGGVPTTQCLAAFANNIYNNTDFSCTGIVSVKVTKLGSTASNATIRPNEFGIGTLTTTLSGGNASVTFSLPAGSKVSVEFSDDLNLNNVMFVFADLLENKVLDSTASTTFMATDSASLRSIPGGKTGVYFRPGVYKIGQWIIPSGITQVYIPGGAFVKGYPVYAHSPLFRINGRGVLTAEGYPYHYPNPGSSSSADWNWLFTQQGGSVIIDGITFLKSSAFTIVSSGTSLHINNIKIIGPYYNNDGITSFADTTSVTSSHIIDGDDSFVVYGNNTTISNNIIWQMQGGIVKIGYVPHSLNGYVITKNYITHDQNPPNDRNQGFICADYEGASTSSAIVQNFTITTNYFDTPIKYFMNIGNDRPGQPSVSQAPWVFTNFTINDIHFTQSGYSSPMVYLHGYSLCSPSYGFNFTNIYMNGSPVSPYNRLFYSKVNLQ